MRLKEKVAIVTGVSQPGQAGYALARAFAREGANLVISSRNAQRVNTRTHELRSEAADTQVLAVAADLTSEAGASKLVQETLGTYGRIDILVNLAGGLTQYGPSHELSLAAWESELNNNLRTAFLCTRAVWPVMSSQGSGKILNFSRAGGVEGSGPMMVAYNCAKAGVDALTRTFAKEGAKIGIYVNAIGPGLLTTETNIAAMKPSAEDLAKQWVSLDLLTEVAIFLVSAASDGINGVTLPVQAKSL
jgi:NAD(P)-dependent dehydrogenase (short-subunit alcohol dehydrogenase family)